MSSLEFVMAVMRRWLVAVAVSAVVAVLLVVHVFVVVIVVAAAVVVSGKWYVASSKY